MSARSEIYIGCLNLFVCCSIVLAQSNPSESGWTTKDFPDPRIDFAKCGNSSPGFLCDPDGLLSDEDRNALKKHVTETEEQSKKVFNRAQFCPNGAPDGLQFFIVLINKIDGSTVGQTETKQFAEEIKAKYDILKDVNTCDTSVIIVTSKNDGQLYTVAGRDAQLPGGTLESAFSQNLVHFGKGDFAAGLTDMTSKLEAAYEVAHTGADKSESANSNSQASSTNNTIESSTGNNEITDLTSSAANGSSNKADNLTTAKNASLTSGESSTIDGSNPGTPIQPVTASGDIDNEALPTLRPFSDGDKNQSSNSSLPGLLEENATLPDESNSLWFNIVQITGTRCGTQHDPDAFLRNVRLVVEEIRDLSARLEKNEQYQNIQKTIQKLKGDPEAETKAWNLGGRPFVESMRQTLINEDSTPLSTACLNDIFV